MTEMRVGARYFSAASSAEVIVVRPAAVALTCAGAPMTDAPNGGAGTAEGAPVQLGKRYEDAESGLVLMVTKSGAGPLQADGRDLVLLAAKPLPSSD